MPLRSGCLRSPTCTAWSVPVLRLLASGSFVTWISPQARSSTLAGSGLPAILASCALTAALASVGWEAIQAFVSTCPRSSARTVSGCWSRNCLDTASVVVTNVPWGHRSFSSTSTFPPPVSTSWDAYGSGTQAPSSWPARNAVTIEELSVGWMLTSPPPVVFVFSPICASQYRSATSCVFPSSGVPSFLPRSWSGAVIDGFTTSSAPPEVAPATSRSASPWLLTYALTAGLGPTYVASTDPPSSASMALGPALNFAVDSFVEPRSCCRIPWLIPTSPLACVTFANTPSRSWPGAPPFELDPPAIPPQAATRSRAPIVAATTESPRTCERSRDMRHLRRPRGPTLGREGVSHHPGGERRPVLRIDEQERPGAGIACVGVEGERRRGPQRHAADLVRGQLGRPLGPGHGLDVELVAEVGDEAGHDPRRVLDEDPLASAQGPLREPADGRLHVLGHARSRLILAVGHDQVAPRDVERPGQADRHRLPGRRQSDVPLAQPVDPRHGRAVPGRQHEHGVPDPEDARSDLPGVSAVLAEVSCRRPQHVLHREPGGERRAGRRQRHLLQVLEQRRAPVPPHPVAPLHDVVTVERGDRDRAHVRDPQRGRVSGDRLLRLPERRLLVPDHVDRDALLALRPQAVREQRQVGRVQAPIAARALQGRQLVDEHGLGVVEQPAHERGLAVVDRPRGRESQQVRPVRHQK